MVRSLVTIVAALTVGVGCFIESVPGVDDPVPPDQVNGPPAITGLAIADDSRCVVHADGKVSCWGSNAHGVFGIPTSERWFSPTPVTVKGIAGAKQVSVRRGACVVKADGSVWCWGAGGLRGDGTRVDEIHPEPVQVPNVAGAIAVESAGYKACAVLSNETFSCWGAANDYYIGDGPPLPRPGPISGLAGVVQGSRGEIHACVVHSSGTASCVGGNRFGELGNGTSDMNIVQRTPVPVAGLTDAVQIAAASETSCALHRDGTVSCWGQTETVTGAAAQNCSGFGCQNVPAVVPGLANVTRISLGGMHLCAVMADKTVQCLGENGYGQLGDGTTTARTTPAPVPGLTDIVEVATSITSTCARRADNVVFCWGSSAVWNEDGSGADSPVPVEVKW